MSEREMSFADGLRALADLLDEKDFQTALDDFRYLVPVGSREKMLEATRQLGGRWEKDATTGSNFFGLTRQVGGGVSIQVYATRENVCERVQVGTRTVEIPDPELVADVPTVTVDEPVYEWFCPPSLLAQEVA